MRCIWSTSVEAAPDKGSIGFSERSGYTAIGTVCNVAARLCANAKDGQILLSQLVNVALKGT